MKKPHHNLPRLSREWYQGLARVHWIITTKDRRREWLDDVFHAAFREIGLHTLSRYGLISPTYCLMPDHIHVLWMGLDTSSDQNVAMEFMRKNLKRFLRDDIEFQQKAYDHVLRQEEAKRSAFQNAAWYILDNPVRAGLVKNRGDYPYSGCLVPGYPVLNPNDDGYWTTFWRIYAKLTSDTKM